MEIITAAFAAAVAAFCFLAILSNDVRDSRSSDAGAEGAPTKAD